MVTYHIKHIPYPGRSLVMVARRGMATTPFLTIHDFANKSNFDYDLAYL